jgi:peptidoglycan/LPS O-acetylase OafA/YrhL
VTDRPPKALRIAYLESIRGLAALQVLLLHFFAAFAPDLVFALPAAAAVAGVIHLSPLYFLYDGYSAVYIFFALSGYVLTRSFERHLAQPSSQILGRVIRLGVPALAATLVAAAVMSAFERPAPVRALLPVFSVIFGVFLCVLAEVWQPQWLRSLCADPTFLLFPGQFAPLQQKTFGAIPVLIGIVDLEVARAFLSRPWLVAKSRLSFPLHLIHWPILFGLAAGLFLLLNGVAGIEIARVGAIVAGICLALVCSAIFLPVDRGALEVSRRLRKRMSRAPDVTPRLAGTDRVVAAE